MYTISFVGSNVIKEMWSS